MTKSATEDQAASRNERYQELIVAISKTLLARPWGWRSPSSQRPDSPWDEFCKQVPQAQGWVNDLAKAENYEPSEHQCSVAVVVALRERGLENWALP